MSKSLIIAIESKEFSLNGKQLPILGNIDFKVEAGELITVLGPSGCGKTTLLRMILGLDNDYKGEIRLGGQIIHRPGLDRGVIFQEPRLVPWMTVRKNVEYAIPEKSDRKAINLHVDRLLETIGLADFQKAFPNQLSGGMAQRVALARALVNMPDLLLLDEPFGALDSYSRMKMQDELLKILGREGTSTLMVTHDIDEAVFLSDKIIVLTHRPSRVRTTFIIDLLRPRQRTSEEFSKLRSEILKNFYES